MSKKPCWISHRGYTEKYCENTLEAFIAAKNLGFSFFETDLRISKDEKIALCHDQSFTRLNGPTTPIHKMSSADIKSISLRGKTYPMLLDELLDKFLDQRWIFDIKPEQGAKTIKILTTTLHNRSLIQWAKDNLWCLLWNQQDEDLLKKSLPGIYTIPASKRCWLAGFSALLNLPFLGNISKTDVFSIPPKILGISLYTPRIFSIYHKKHAKILSYLPENKEDTLLACKLGADYILTNLSPL